MTISEKLELAQKAAPSYVVVLPDGAPMKCDECGNRDCVGFVKPFTPDGKFHPAVHLDCLDPEWVSIARKIEFTI